jgi:hypothetical protein
MSDDFVTCVRRALFEAPAVSPGLQLLIIPELEDGSRVKVVADHVKGAAVIGVVEFRYGSGQVALTATECEALAEVLASAARDWRAKQAPPVVDLAAAEHGYAPEGEEVEIP